MKNKIECLEIKNCFDVEYAKIKFPQSLTENKYDLRNGDSSILGIYYHDYKHKDLIFKAIDSLKKAINLGPVYCMDWKDNSEINISVIINNQTYLFRLKSFAFYVGYVGTKKYKYSIFPDKVPKNIKENILDFSNKIVLFDRKYHSIKEQMFEVYAGNIVVSKDIDIAVNEYDLVKHFELIQQHGNGQLICNLTNTCLLNVLEDYNFRFETANPQNKFIKISKRGNSNLRDVYLRALRLGGLQENLIEKDWDPIDLIVEFDKIIK